VTPTVTREERAPTVTPTRPAVTPTVPTERVERRVTPTRPPARPLEYPSPPVRREERPPERRPPEVLAARELVRGERAKGAAVPGAARPGLAMPTRPPEVLAREYERRRVYYPPQRPGRVEALPVVRRLPAVLPYAPGGGLPSYRRLYYAPTGIGRVMGPGVTPRPLEYRPRPPPIGGAVRRGIVAIT